MRYRDTADDTQTLYGMLRTAHDTQTLGEIIINIRKNIKIIKMNLKESLKPSRLTWKIFAALAIILFLLYLLQKLDVIGDVGGIILFILFYVPVALLPVSLKESLLTCIYCGWGIPELSAWGWAVSGTTNVLFFYFMSLIISKIILRSKHKDPSSNSNN